MVCIHVFVGEDRRDMTLLAEEFRKSSVEADIDSVAGTVTCPVSDAEQAMAILHSNGYRPTID